MSECVRERERESEREREREKKKKRKRKRKRERERKKKKQSACQGVCVCDTETCQETQQELLACSGMTPSRGGQTRKINKMTSSSESDFVWCVCM